MPSGMHLPYIVMCSLAGFACSAATEIFIRVYTFSEARKRHPISMFFKATLTFMMKSSPVQRPPETYECIIESYTHSHGPNLGPGVPTAQVQPTSAVCEALHQGFGKLNMAHVDCDQDAETQGLCSAAPLLKLCKSKFIHNSTDASGHIDNAI